MPLTYDLNVKSDWEEIFNILKTEEDSDEVRWIMKKSRNSHNASGIKVVTKDNKKKIIEK